MDLSLEKQLMLAAFELEIQNLNLPEALEMLVEIYRYHLLFKETCEMIMKQSLEIEYDR